MLIIDKELGNIILVSNARSKHVTARYKDGSFRITYPAYLSLSKVKSTIDSMRPRLEALKKRSPARIILSPENGLKTMSFEVIIKESDYANYYSRLSDGKLIIICPSGTDFNSEATQALIRSLIEKYLRKEAGRILSDKVRRFAAKYNFTHGNIRINKSISRWGSCSSKKNINLSYRCMLLPEQLADFIILHELCHTVEMNHGEKFWQLLDKVTDGNSKQLDRELKKFKPQY